MYSEGGLLGIPGPDRLDFFDMSSRLNIFRDPRLVGRAISPIAKLKDRPIGDKWLYFPMRYKALGNLVAYTESRHRPMLRETIPKVEAREYETSQYLEISTGNLRIVKQILDIATLKDTECDHQ